MSPISVFTGTVITILLWAVVFMVRNQLVYMTRIKARHLEDFPRSYQSLPEYADMLWHVKYLLLWTPNQWFAWLERNRKESA